MESILYVLPSLCLNCSPGYFRFRLVSRNRRRSRFLMLLFREKWPNFGWLSAYVVSPLLSLIFIWCLVKCSVKRFWQKFVLVCFATESPFDTLSFWLMNNWQVNSLLLFFHNHKSIISFRFWTKQTQVCELFNDMCCVPVTFTWNEKNCFSYRTVLLNYAYTSFSLRQLLFYCST